MPVLLGAEAVSMELRRAAAAMKAIATYCKAMDDRDVSMADIVPKALELEEALRQLRSVTSD